MKLRNVINNIIIIYYIIVNYIYSKLIVTKFQFIELSFLTYLKKCYDLEFNLATQSRRYC